MQNEAALKNLKTPDVIDLSSGTNAEFEPAILYLAFIAANGRSRRLFDFPGQQAASIDISVKHDNQLKPGALYLQ
jgi:hypothetical protein